MGNGIWYCPHCDGFATTDKKLITIASNEKNNEAIEYAKLFLGWTKDITVFIQKPDFKYTKDQSTISSKLTDEQNKEAISLGIHVVDDDEIVEIIGDLKTNTIKSVLTKTDAYYEADIIFYHHGIVIQNETACQLGAELDEGYVKVNSKRLTSVDKVYAAGDIDTDRYYSILASATRAIAAVTIYEQLIKEAISIVKSENSTQ